MPKAATPPSLVQKQIAAAMFATTKYHQIFGIKLSRKMLSQVVEKEPNSEEGAQAQATLAALP